MTKSGEGINSLYINLFISKDKNRSDIGTLDSNGFPNVMMQAKAVCRIFSIQIIMKSLDPLRAKKIFIRKKLGHTAVSAIKASSLTL